VYKCLVN